MLRSEFVARTYAARLIDRKLLLDREVQGEMQKRVEPSAFRREVPSHVAIRIVEKDVVLGVKQHDRECGLFEPLKRFTPLILAPRIEKKPACFVAGRGEHRGALDR